VGRRHRKRHSSRDKSGVADTSVVQSKESTGDHGRAISRPRLEELPGAAALSRADPRWEFMGSTMQPTPPGPAACVAFSLILVNRKPGGLQRVDYVLQMARGVISGNIPCSDKIEGYDAVFRERQTLR
jgi:hypothetical protein